MLKTLTMETIEKGVAFYALQEEIEELVADQIAKHIESFNEFILMASYAYIVATFSVISKKIMMLWIVINICFGITVGLVWIQLLGPAAIIGYLILSILTTISIVVYLRRKAYIDFCEEIKSFDDFKELIEEMAEGESVIVTDMQNHHNNLEINTVHNYYNQYSKLNISKEDFAILVTRSMVHEQQTKAMRHFFSELDKNVAFSFKKEWEVISMNHS